MRKVTDIVRELRNDKTPHKGWTEPPKMEEEAPPAPAKVLHQPMPKTRAIPVVIPREQVRVHTEQMELDASCEHKWSWKDGKKTCWLCGGDAPVDRRDASTSWRAKVYGTK